eukprot:scaffold37540_cov28-Tisochrysis_lutea.AAC.2
MLLDCLGAVVKPAKRRWSDNLALRACAVGAALERTDPCCAHTRRMVAHTGSRVQEARRRLYYFVF